MSKRQIGLSEAIYRALPNMHLHQSNIGTIFVHSGYPENQSRFLRKVSEDRETKECEDSNSISSDESDCDHDADESKITEGGHLIKIQGREGVYMEVISIHERYAARPKVVEDLSLAQFATCYTRCTRKPKFVEFENV